jgi:hypothetical protein
MGLCTSLDTHSHSAPYSQRAQVSRDHLQPPRLCCDSVPGCLALGSERERLPLQSQDSCSPGEPGILIHACTHVSASYYNRQDDMEPPAFACAGEGEPAHPISHDLEHSTQDCKSALFSLISQLSTEATIKAPAGEPRELVPC